MTGCAPAAFFVCKQQTPSQITLHRGISSYVAERSTTVSVFQSEPTEQNHERASAYEGPYPPPQRACYVCGKRGWRWNGEGYFCASGDPAHEEYERLTWTKAGCVNIALAEEEKSHGRAKES
jgi:hypothetical protein